MKTKTILKFLIALWSTIFTFLISISVHCTVSNAYICMYMYIHTYKCMYATSFRVTSSRHWNSGTACKKWTPFVFVVLLHIILHIYEVVPLLQINYAKYFVLCFLLFNRILFIFFFVFFANIVSLLTATTELANYAC